MGDEQIASVGDGGAPKSPVVAGWTSFDAVADVEAERNIGSMGGFFEHGMRWRDYIETWREERVPYIEAIRNAVLADDLRVCGDEHEAGMTPVFDDGAVATFSWRGWGDLMAAIWAEAEDADYCYMDFYMAGWGCQNKGEKEGESDD